MRYPIAIEAGGNDSAFGVIVPDLPGCFSAGDTRTDAIAATGDAIAAWIDAVTESGGAIPLPSMLAAVRDRPDYAGWTFAVVDVDRGPLDDATG